MVISLINLIEPFTNTQILLILLVVYLISLYLSIKFDGHVMYLSAILWLIPLTWFNDILIITVFIIMFFVHIIIPLGSLRSGDDDF